MAMILITGCSTAVKRKASFFMTSLAPKLPKSWNPFGETKYMMKPTTNWMCVAINPNKAIFLSRGVNSFLEVNPMKLLTTATTNNSKAK